MHACNIARWLLEALKLKLHKSQMLEGCLRLCASGCKGTMSQKRNVVLYLDTDLVKKSRELGFNLSRTFETHLKRLVVHVDTIYDQNNSHGWWAGPDLNRRPSARQADVLTELDYRPSMFVGYFQYIALN